MNSAIFWNKGMRVNNEDSATIQQVVCGKRQILFVAVADGIGGLEAGEIASGYALEEYVNWFYDEAIYLIGKKRSLWECSISRITYRIYEAMKRYGFAQDIRMGTTCTAYILWQKRSKNRVHYVSFHLGDSRSYSIGKRRTKQLNVLDQNEAGALTACIGTLGFFMPKVKIGSFRSDSGIFLCSDGFQGTLTIADIQNAFKGIGYCTEAQLERRLVAMAKKSEKLGSTDNQTAVIVGW